MNERTPVPIPHQSGSASFAGFIGRTLLLLGLMLAILSSTWSAGTSAQAPEADQQSGESGDAHVVIIPIQGTIGPGLGHFLERSINEAEEAGATTIILDINTPGGRLDTVLEMRDDIMDTDIPVVAFVNREAFSAGALITIASDTIYMAPGAVYGAATPIVGGTGETASEKTISAVRSTFRATAEEQGRDPMIAEAMVDPDVVIEGLDSSTSLLTLTADQALEVGYAEGVAESPDELLRELGLGAATTEVASMTVWERAVSWITNPIVASLLILIGIALIVVDGLVGGFGVVALGGIACLGLFFWGHQLAGLAGWEDLILIVVGIVLIGIEVFVIPGFGLADILGGISLVGGLVLAMTRRSFGDEGFTVEVTDVLQTLLITLALTVVAIVLFSWALPRLVPSLAKPARGAQRMTLSATVASGGKEASRPGFFSRLLGGGDVLERDVDGHTALGRKPRSDPHSPRDPGRRS